jgi:hypothetical protein
MKYLTCSRKTLDTSSIEDCSAGFTDRLNLSCDNINVITLILQYVAFLCPHLTLALSGIRLSSALATQHSRSTSSA